MKNSLSTVKCHSYILKLHRLSHWKMIHVPFFTVAVGLPIVLLLKRTKHRNYHRKWWENHFTRVNWIWLFLAGQIVLKMGCKHKTITIASRSFVSFYSFDIVYLLCKHSYRCGFEMFIYILICYDLYWNKNDSIII